MNKPRFLLLTGMILAAALSRLIPHPPNFSPVAALALFGGAAIASKRLAFALPLAAMFLSDLILGFSSMTPVIYGCFALIVCLGFWVKQNQNVGRIGLAAVVGALLFFIVTNFGVWAMGSYYPKTGAGLAECFTAKVSDNEKQKCPGYRREADASDVLILLHPKSKADNERETAINHGRKRAESQNQIAQKHRGQRQDKGQPFAGDGCAAKQGERGDRTEIRRMRNQP